MLVENYIAAHKDRKARVKSDGAGRGAGSVHSRNTQPLPTDSVQPKGISCFSCGRVGHKSPAFPLRKPRKSHLCYVPIPTPPLKIHQNKEPVITTELNGKPITALVDTGIG